MEQHEEEFQSKLEQAHTEREEAERQADAEIQWL